MIQQSPTWVFICINENINSKRYLHPNFYYGTILNSQDMEITWVSINGLIDKENVIHEDCSESIQSCHLKK